MKYLKVTMLVAVKEDKDVAAIKAWERHIDYAINLAEYPEIDHISNVRVTEADED